MQTVGQVDGGVEIKDGNNERTRGSLCIKIWRKLQENRKGKKDRGIGGSV